ncbi:Protein of unknown function DUF179 [gamma proteobacterium HdN1]|nr:Protein of unknown function DUF179 [gamma proteobacterium HdN1]
MSTENHFKNHFLIAMPTLEDPNFSQTITYICEHSAEGAMGIVVNRPSDLTVAQVFNHLEIPMIDDRFTQQMVLHGGPVQVERGFVLHRDSGNWDSTVEIQDGIYLSTSKEILAAMAQGHGPEKALIALGYAGWGAGQLDDEMANNAWLSVPASDSILFDVPYEQRWHAAAKLLGVDISLLSTQAGHA